MTTTENPLPAHLAIPDGDEPVSEEALQWLTGRIADEPELTLAEVVASAEAGADDWSLSDEGLHQLTRWEVDGPGTAEWALRKMAAVEAEGEEVAAQAEAWIASVERWRDERLRPLNARAAFFTDRLVGWLRRLREADPKVKSRALPSGTVSSRTVPAKVEVVDVEAVAAWARGAGRDDVLKVTVRLTELKAAVVVDEEAGVARDADSGLPVPGAVVHPGGVSFSVKVGG